MLGSALRTLDVAAASKLMPGASVDRRCASRLRRLAPGRYEIDGRKVTVRPAALAARTLSPPRLGRRGPHRDRGRGPRPPGLVHAAGALQGQTLGLPRLPAYLGQAGNVVASLTGQRAARSSLEGGLGPR